MASNYDALLVVSFGGPEGPHDVVPFLNNVLKGKNVPPERVREVARHYDQFGGVSPINEHNRLLIKALEELLSSEGPELPIYWGNRNWHPFLPDTLKQMSEDGIRNALAFVTSAYGSYSGCRQYLENIKEARVQVGPYAPEVEKLRLFFNHPGFIEANADHLLQSLQQLPDERRTKAKVIFTAHSIPKSMAEGCQYVSQLKEASQLVSDAVNHKDWELVYQSRSGPASQPWLSPDICDYLEDVAACGYNDVVVHPIGFLSDHLEVIYDIDLQAKEKADQLKINLIRAATAGVHPAFVRMIHDLILEKTADAQPKVSGEFGLVPEQCQTNCCSYAPVRRI